MQKSRLTDEEYMILRHTSFMLVIVCAVIGTHGILTIYERYVHNGTEAHLLGSSSPGPAPTRMLRDSGVRRPDSVHGMVGRQRDANPSNTRRDPVHSPDSPWRTRRHLLPHLSEEDVRLLPRA